MAGRYQILENQTPTDGLSQKAINLGKFYVVDTETNPVVGKYFETWKEAEGHVYDLLTGK